MKQLILSVLVTALTQFVAAEPIGETVEEQKPKDVLQLCIGDLGESSSESEEELTEDELYIREIKQTANNNRIVRSFIVEACSEMLFLSDNFESPAPKVCSSSSTLSENKDGEIVKVIAEVSCVDEGDDLKKFYSVAFDFNSIDADFYSLNIESVSRLD